MCCKIDFERRLLFGHVTELCICTRESHMFAQFLLLCPSAPLCLSLTSLSLPAPSSLPPPPDFLLLYTGPVLSPHLCLKPYLGVIGKCVLCLCLSTHPGWQNKLIRVQSYHMKTFWSCLQAWRAHLIWSRIVACRDLQRLGKSLRKPCVSSWTWCSCLLYPSFLIWVAEGGG
jgi:hypothetical protein